ncbi:cytochrome b [Bradyrhizobium cenepequi]
MSSGIAVLANPAKATGLDGGGPHSSQDRYNATARLFHWTIALLMAGMYVTDWARGAAERGSPGRVWWLSAHESLGLLVLVLTIARLSWRLTHPAPPIHGTPLVRRVAEAGHALLYLATLGLPLAGIGRAMSGGGDVVFFGLVIPSLTGRNDTLAALTSFLHGGLVMNLLLALIAGHVLAAMWHQFLLKDGTLRRML